MSFSCTLHPVDPRAAQALIAQIKTGRANWRFLMRLWTKKRRINRINQPFKQGLKELLRDNPDFIPEIHLWGRPFFSFATDPEEVAQKITMLYGARHPEEIKKFYLRELVLYSETAYWEKAGFKYPRYKEPRLGITQVVRELQQLYHKGKYQQVAAEVGFVLAQLLGVAYPYWSCGSYGLSFLKDLNFQWPRETAGLAGLFAGLPEITQYMTERLDKNLSAGVYLNPVEVRELLTSLNEATSEWLAKLQWKQLSKPVASVTIQLVKEALTYAKSINSGLLEASDIFETAIVRYP